MASDTSVAAMAILEQKGCFACHSVDGPAEVGPSFMAAFGREKIVVAEGEERRVIVDEAYLKQAIQDPMSEISKGYPPAMPSLTLSEDELQEVIEFLKEPK